MHIRKLLNALILFQSPALRGGFPDKMLGRNLAIKAVMFQSPALRGGFPDISFMAIGAIMWYFVSIPCITGRVS